MTLLEIKPHYLAYKGFYLCQLGEKYWRVKAHPNDGYALHHGSFETEDEAKKFVDEMKENK